MFMINCLAYRRAQWITEAILIISCHRNFNHILSSMHGVHDVYMETNYTFLTMFV